jgi:hypothetical protein
MSGKIAVLMFIGMVVVATEDFSRKDAKAQSKTFGFQQSSFAALRLCGRTDLVQSEDLAVEVFQVLDLPLSVHEASLVKTDKGFFVRLSLGNNTELKMVGLRYSLVTIDSKNQLQFIANRVEGFSLPAYATKTVTFKTPLKFKTKDGERLALMVEQVVSRESIWEVIKAKDAFEAYARGDYSVVPVVLRVANQVDAPPGQSRIFFRQQ